MLPDSRLRHLLSSKLMLLVVATILLTPAAALSADFGLVPTAPPNNNVEGSTVTFQVLVTGGSDSTPTITVDFEINGGPTIEDDDFLPGTNVSLAAGLTGTLTITGGVIDGQTYDLPIVLDDDVRVEANEFFGIAITGVSVGTSSGTPAVATIVNNDTATVQISTADQTVTEGDTGVTYTVELVGDIDPALTGDVTVTYGFDEAGTDTAEGVDYTDTIGGPVVLNQASRTHNIVLDIDDDGIVEPSEDFTLDLTGASASFGVGLGTDVQAITTITDDGDTATVQIVSGHRSQTVTEGDTDVTYTVELVGDIDDDVTGVTVTYGFDLGGTDTAESSDYADTTTPPVTLSQSSRTFDIQLDILDDGIVESGEDFTLALTGVSGLSGVVLGSATDIQAATSINADGGDTATVRIASGDRSQTVSEGQTNVTYTVELVGDIDEDASVEVSYGFNQLGSDTAESADYADVTPGTVTLTQASRTYDIVLNITNDLIVEPGEDFTLDLIGLSSLSGVDLGSAAEIQAITSINVDSSDTATVQIASSDRTKAVAEGDTDVTYTVELVGDIDDDVTGVTVAYGFDEGGTDTAESADYADTTTPPVTLSQASRTFDIVVDIVNDDIVEPGEDFTLDLTGVSGLSGVILGSAADIQASTSIDVDSADTAVVNISAGDRAKSVSEGNTGVTFMAELVGDIDDTAYVDVNFTFNQAGSDTATYVTDYTDETVTPVRLTQGAKTYPITVDIVGDTVVELPEDFTIDLTDVTTSLTGVSLDATPGSTQAVGTITNMDSAIASVTSTSLSVTEADSVSVDITVTLDRPIQDGAQVEVGYATADDTANAMADYTPASGTLVFDNGTGSYTITIPITNDQVVEPDGETFRFELSAVSNSVISSTDGYATVSIDDNDNTITLSTTADGFISPSGDVNVEDGASLTVNLSWVHEYQDLLLDGSSVDGSSGTYVYTATDRNDHTIHLVARHAIDVTVGLYGSVEIDGTPVTTGDTLIVNHDHTATADMTPDPDHCVREVTLGSTTLGSALSYSLGPIVESTTFEAYFRDQLLTVQIEPERVRPWGRWRLNRWDTGTSSWVALTTWMEHDDTVAVDCYEPSLRVEFNEVPGWIKPNNYDYTIDTSTTGHPTVVGTYGALTVNLVLEVLSPDGSEVISADPTGSMEAGLGQQVYMTGEDVNLSVASTGSTEFAQWQERAGGEVSNLGADPVLSITMGTDRTIIAVFIDPGADNDGDGYTAAEGDCNDTPGGTGPSAGVNIHSFREEVCGDGVNNDCDATTSDLCGPLDSDDDNDDFTENQGDCDDTNPDIHPGATEICGNSVDEDCYDGDRPCGSEANCVSIANTPLDTTGFNAGANIMFILDDSGSMDWEFMVQGAGNGVYNGNVEYVFDDPGNDNAYQSGGYSTILNDTQRRDWRTQWAGYNKIYYNPSVTYVPWPRWETLTDIVDTPVSNGNNADLDDPRQDPLDDSDTLNLDGTYVTIARLAIDNLTQRIRVTRENDGDNGNSTLADAIALVPASVYTAAGGDAATLDAQIRAGGSGIIVVDNQDTEQDGTEYFREYGPGWDTSQSPNPWDGQARYTTGDGSFGEWYIEEVSGDYHVFTWVNDYTQRDHSARYDIYHDNGSQTIYHRDQAVGGAQWVELWDGSTHAPLTFTPSPPRPDDNVKNAHYYTWRDDGDGTVDAGEVYLVEMDGYDDGNTATGQINVYRYNGTDNSIEDGELQLVTRADAVAAGAWPLTPDGSEMEFADARQNFANYYSFYRRRELAAKAAVGRVIDSMSGVYIGLYSIHNRINETVVPVNVEDLSGNELDQTDDLLEALYGGTSNNSTPLRRALEAVGRYFHVEDGQTGGIGTSPFFAEQDGGGCQKAFAILMTDGYYNGSDPHTTAIGNEDGDGNTDFDTILNSDGSGASFSDSSSDTLADVAMYYYENDLAPNTLSDFVPQAGYDTATHQHMVTYGVAFGVTGSLDPDAWPDCLPECSPEDEGCETLCPTWPTPDSGPHRIDDLYHASINGRGRFLSAGSPQELVDGLMTIKDDIESKIHSGAAVSINAHELNEGTTIYQAIYRADNWKGDLITKCLDPTSGEIVDCSGGITYGDEETLVGWSADQQLQGRSTTVDSDTGDEVPDRQIITFDGVNGVAFRYDDLTAAQKAMLGATEAEQRQVLNYIRGSNSREVRNGGAYRNRHSTLGDFVHSSPHLVTLPGANGILDSRLDPTNDDEGLVFIGGNDGMLHAFNADTGDEVFAYIPNQVFRNLDRLTEPLYNHRYYVDNGAYAARVSGQTLVVGALGKGGKGIYCLDASSVDDGGSDSTLADSRMTTAEFNATDIVKWEFPSSPMDASDVSPDDDMGYTFSQPYIVNSTVGPVAIFGNGYDSTDGHAVLFVLNALNGSEVARIDTEAGDPSSDECNGLSTPALIDVNYDGLVDYVFAGDLLGNLWKFDLTAADPAYWKVSYNTNADGSGDPRPLFQAVNKRGMRQPITGRPDVMIPCGALQKGYLVVFSTGRYLGSDDFADITVKSAYGVWDWQDAWDYAGETSADKYLGHLGTPDSNEFRQLSNLPNFVGSLYLDRLTLQEQRQISYDANEGYRVLTDNPVEWALVPPAPAVDTTEHLGWYFDLPATGERSTQNIIIRGGLVIMISNIPDSSPCSSSGASILHVLNSCTGGRINVPVIDISGPDGTPDGVLDSHDLINIGTEAHPVWVAPTGLRKDGTWYTPAIVSLLDRSGDLAFSATSEGEIERLKIQADPVGFQYWREIN